MSAQNVKEFSFNGHCIGSGIISMWHLTIIRISLSDDWNPLWTTIFKLIWLYFSKMEENLLTQISVVTMIVIMPCLKICCLHSEDSFFQCGVQPTFGIPCPLIFKLILKIASDSRNFNLFYGVPGLWRDFKRSFNLCHTWWNMMNRCTSFTKDGIILLKRLFS